MSWKRNIQLLDLDPGERMEVLCRRCGQTSYLTPPHMGKPHLYLDEAEAALQCARRGCGGAVLLAMSTQGAGVSFSGGIA